MEKINKSEKPDGGNTEKKPGLKLWLTVGGIAVALILAVILIVNNKNEGSGDEWAPVIPGESVLQNNGENSNPNGNGSDAEHSDNNGGSELVPVGTNEVGETLVGTGETAPTTGSNSSTGNTQGNTTPIPTLGDEDPYEDWLASAIIIGISMQYSDYEFLGIYTGSETPVGYHQESEGAYVIFMGDGEKRAIQSFPLDGERDDKGTVDLYVPAIGYATYEHIDPENIPVGSLKVRTLEDLEHLIIASSQVSIIER